MQTPRGYDDWMNLSYSQIAQFHETLWTYYAGHARHNLPWRAAEDDGQFDPYKIMVSELMLQQTQVARVIPKYHAFLTEFPNISVLAQAELSEVLRVWQGLGYNRRAKYLWLAARQIDQLGAFPGSAEELVRLPGIGTNTAGAILAYAFNESVVFIETNVRTVIIHHFFADAEDIPDSAIRDSLSQVLNHETPREFYWALMDYGSHLKTTQGNASRRSKHYAKQSTFVGSKRQIRGAVIRALSSGAHTIEDLGLSDERLPTVLSELVAEGLIRQKANLYHL